MLGHEFGILKCSYGILEFILIIRYLKLANHMYVYVVMYFFFLLCLGYYADPEMGCQAYHVCLLDPLGGSMYPTSFLCPNGTLFQQQIFNCDWWYDIDSNKYKASKT